MNNSIILNFLFICILLLEYYLVYRHFNKRAYYSKIGLLFLLYLVISSFDSYYIFVNNGFILFIILVFYQNKEAKINNKKSLIIKDKQQYENENENTNTNTNVETFTDFKKLKQLKENNNYQLKEGLLNTKNIRKSNKTKKEKFNNTHENDESKSIEKFKSEFNKYKFTRPVKSSIDALNKIPYFIKQFNAIWE
jgi:hypothetical protein